MFLANRIECIRSSTSPEQWRHVSPENNPADHASRGLIAYELKESTWVKNPDLIWQQNNLKGEKTVGEVETTGHELCKVHAHAVKSKVVNSLVNRFNKFSGLKR